MASISDSHIDGVPKISNIEQNNSKNTITHQTPKIDQVQNLGFNFSNIN
jgi:hypothetical protein